VFMCCCAMQVQCRKQSESSSTVERDGEWAICGFDGQYYERAHVDCTEEVLVMPPGTVCVPGLLWPADTDM
jgi:hypothetical protein